MVTQIKQKVNENREEFSKHKQFAENLQTKISNFYLGINGEATQKSEQIKNCGNRLAFETFENEENTTKLASANFCKHRLCPYCAWRWHIKMSKLMQRTFEIIGEKNFHHIVLTIPNIKFLTKEFLLQLREKATKMIKKELKCNDFMISFEITISKEGTFHPHFHCLCILNDNRPTRKFIQTKWAEISNCGNNFAICDIKKCTDNKISQELTKYILKFENSDEINDKKLYIINKAIKGLRKFATGGIIKKAEAQAKKEIERNLFEEMQELSKYDSEVYFFEWFKGNYNLTEIQKVRKETRKSYVIEE